MAGLSTTLYDSGSIAISSGAAGDTASSISGGTFGGRALSARRLGAAAGLRYAEIRIAALHTGLKSPCIGVTRTTGSLSDYPGADADSVGFFWHNTPGSMTGFQGGSQFTSASSAGAVGMIALLWVDCATGKIWITSTDQGTGVGYNDAAGRPDDGTGQIRTLSGSGDLSIALAPGYGAGSDTTVLELRTRYSQLKYRGATMLGALPWDARSVTIVEDVSGVPEGTVLRYAWFDEARPHLLSQPTTRGSVTKTAGQVSVTISTSLDAAGVGSLLLSDSDGTVIQCRSHYAPAAVS